MEINININWKKIVLTVQRMYCRIFRGGVSMFLMMNAVLVSRMVVVEIDYTYGLKCESRYLFSCRYLDNISDLLLSRVFFMGE